MITLRTVSGRRYRIGGPLPSPYGEEFQRRLTDRRFLPLSAHEECSFGWVTADNLLITDFDVDTVIRGEHALFALRLDRRRVNAKLLRAQIDLEIRGRRKAAEDAGHRRRLTRDERLQIRADMKTELLERTNPSVQVCTLILHPKRRVLHVLSLTRSLNEIVVRHWRDTFGVELAPVTPWFRGGEILAGTTAATILPNLERTDFAGPPGRGASRAPALVEVGR